MRHLALAGVVVAGSYGIVERQSMPDATLCDVAFGGLCGGGGLLAVVIVIGRSVRGWHGGGIGYL